eukprot:239645_1
MMIILHSIRHGIHHKQEDDIVFPKCVKTKTGKVQVQLYKQWTTVNKQMGFKIMKSVSFPQRTQFDPKSTYSHSDLTTNATTENVNNAVCEKTRNRPRKMDANRFLLNDAV